MLGYPRFILVSAVNDCMDIATHNPIKKILLNLHTVMFGSSLEMKQYPKHEKLLAFPSCSRQQKIKKKKKDATPP